MRAATSGAASELRAMTTKADCSPDASMLLTGYNQRRFIGEAIEGAFRQTYPRLEIILSDDASTDDTYAVMESMAAGYRGPHSIVLNRNERNLGVARHISDLAQRAHGRFLFIAGGDDVSLPNRVSRCMEMWATRANPPSMVFTNLRTIDEHGVELQPAFFLRQEKRAGVLVGLKFAQHSGSADIPELTALPESLYRCVIGASMALDRRLIDEFGPLAEDLAVEDVPLSFRALLAGSVEYVDEPLVDYRRHSLNFLPDDTSEDVRARAEDRNFRAWVNFTKAYLRDAHTAWRKGMINRSTYSELRSHILYAQYRRRTEIRLRDCDYGLSLLEACAGMICGGRRLHFCSWCVREYMPALATGLRGAGRKSDVQTNKS